MGVTHSSSCTSRIAASRGVSPGSMRPPGPLILPAPSPRFLRISRICPPRITNSSVARCCGSHAFQSIVSIRTPGRSRASALAHLPVGPVEPRHQRFDVVVVHRRPAPDAQAGGRIAVARGVEGHAFVGEQRHHRLDGLGALFGLELEEPRVHHLQADRRARARLRVARQEVDPGGLLRPLRDGGEVRLRALDQAGSPPSLSAQSRPSRASSTQRSDGVLMVAPVKMPLMSFPPLVSRKTLGSGHAGV